MDNIKDILNIKNIEAKQTPLILAPMAGVSDLAFREICMQHSCNFSYCEMVSAKAISYNSQKTYRLLEYNEKAMPFGVQIFGHEPVIMGEIARRISEDENVTVIDINMGCPAPKIFNNGDGSALMKDMVLASKVIEYTVKNSHLPVTVKIRKGVDDEHINAVEFAKMAEESGAKLLTIHGRTRKEMYSGSSDLDIIAQIKQNANIPIIGNGDIKDAESGKHMLSYTKCDGLMIGRAAQGNPFIFDEVRSALDNYEYTPPTFEERLKTALSHAKLHNEYKSDAAFAEMRKHVAWYIRGIRGSSVLRTKVFSANSLSDIENILDELSRINE